MSRLSSWHKTRNRTFAQKESEPMDTYTLKISKAGQFEHIIEIPELGTTVTSATVDGALVEAKRAIEKHLTTRYLILVFEDQHFDDQGWFIEPQVRLTDLE